MALTLYTNAQSRGVVVDWLISDLGIEVEHQEIAYGAEMKSPEFLKLNPFGKVPVLVDGDVVIYEMAAICAYLADKFFDKPAVVYLPFNNCSKFIPVSSSTTSRITLNFFSPILK